MILDVVGNELTTSFKELKSMRKWINCLLAKKWLALGVKAITL